MINIIFICLVIFCVNTGYLFSQNVSIKSLNKTVSISDLTDVVQSDKSLYSGNYVYSGGFREELVIHSNSEGSQITMVNKEYLFDELKSQIDFYNILFTDNKISAKIEIPKMSSDDEVLEPELFEGKFVKYENTTGIISFNKYTEEYCFYEKLNNK